MTRLERLKERLDMYYACEEAILTGAQSHSFEGRNITRADLKDIRQMIETLETQIAGIENAARYSHTRYVVPVDL